jgi:prepilin-type N-terminal cleavage/methylation domain-containing protein
MPTDPPSASAGFTLLEMIVAFVILSISLMVATQAIALASRSSVAADEREIAIELVASIRATHLQDGIREVLDERARTWKLWLRRPTAQTLLKAPVFALTLTSPRGASYSFLIPDEDIGQAATRAQ